MQQQPMTSTSRSLSFEYRSKIHYKHNRFTMTLDPTTKAIGVLLLGLLLLPFLLAPILPKRYKAKCIIQLQCSVEKAFEILTQDPRKCPMNKVDGLEASRKDADKDGKPLKWREQVIKGRLSDIYIIEQSFVPPSSKKGADKGASVVRKSKHETKEIETEWNYKIEPVTKGSCFITLEGYTDISGYSMTVPMIRMMMFMDGTARKTMVSHLNMVAKAAGGDKKWVA